MIMFWDHFSVSYLKKPRAASKVELHDWNLEQPPIHHHSVISSPSIQLLIHHLKQSLADLKDLGLDGSRFMESFPGPDEFPPQRPRVFLRLSDVRLGGSAQADGETGPSGPLSWTAEPLTDGANARMWSTPGLSHLWASRPMPHRGVSTVPILGFRGVGLLARLARFRGSPGCVISSQDTRCVVLQTKSVWMIKKTNLHPQILSTDPHALFLNSFCHLNSCNLCHRVDWWAGVTWSELQVLTPSFSVRVCSMAEFSAKPRGQPRVHLKGYWVTGHSGGYTWFDDFWWTFSYCLLEEQEPLKESSLTYNI